MPEVEGPGRGNDNKVNVNQKPEWLKIDLRGGEGYAEVAGIVEKNDLHTICSSGKCPNKTECWSRRTATFMVLGDVCTRRCGFCATDSGKPLPVDAGEPARVARSVALMGLKYAVLTSVTRDDLPDGGAAHWAAVVRAVREVAQARAGAETSRTGAVPQPSRSEKVRRGDRFRELSVAKEARPEHLGESEGQDGRDSRSLKTSPSEKNVTIEILIPDFGGSKELLDIVLAAGADVVGHNLETVRRLTPGVRSGASYERSLEVLRYISSQESRVKSQESANATQKEPAALPLDGLMTHNSSLMTVKSGLMVGLGETPDEVLEAMDDLRAAGVSSLTLGQYLQPTRAHLPVVQYVTPMMFEFYKEQALARGFSRVQSGPLVRSSYHADAAL